MKIAIIGTDGVGGFDLRRVKKLMDIYGYYNLCLLPFATPLINNWRKRMLRERDLMDIIF